MATRENLRNIAIIAHVDHGKTTLVDELLKQSGTFRANEVVDERVMDSNDIERERGITILSKTTSVMYGDTKINIVDTPGHADFGGEVERILQMVDGVLLVVDAFEGCMPQTRFVLKKALGLKKKPLVVVNKIDREGSRPEEVVDEVLDLFIELGADEDQIEFPVVYASAKGGYASLDPHNKGTDMQPLFKEIVEEIPAPEGDPDGGLQILISNIDYDDYVGRIGVGRVERGTVKNGQGAVLCGIDGTRQNVRIQKLYQYEGLKRVETDSATYGDLICVSGINSINIGETLCSYDCVEPLPFVKIDEPTVTMNFIVNNSPFAGREGKFVTSRNLRDRLFKEIETNVALRVEETDSADTFKVSGRGELHLSILIETMRREGYELQVSRPEVIIKEIDGVKCEPFERVQIDTPEEYQGSIIQALSERKGDMLDMQMVGNGQTRLIFLVPARGLIGFSTEFLSMTRGYGIMNHTFDQYLPVVAGEIGGRHRGALVSIDTGKATTYSIMRIEERGTIFVNPGTEVYEGMIVGENARENDLGVNITTAKQMTNVRSATKDQTAVIKTPRILTLEESLEFLDDDEYMEVTPESIRLRKQILNKAERDKANKRKKKAAEAE